MTIEFYINSLPGGVVLISGLRLQSKKKQISGASGVDDFFPSAPPALSLNRAHHPDPHIPTWICSALPLDSFHSKLLCAKTMYALYVVSKALPGTESSQMGPEILDTAFGG